MEFIKLYDQEVLRLLKKNSVLAWAVYHTIRRCAYVDKKHPERGYWSFPTGLWIWKHLQKVDNSRFELTNDEEKQVGRVIGYLEELDLIRVHKPLAILDEKKKKAKTQEEKRRWKAEYDLSVKVRDDLCNWGKMKKNTGRHRVFELTFLRAIEMGNHLSRSGDIEETEMSRVETEMSRVETEMSRVETEMSSEEEELNNKKKNTNTIINMNREIEPIDWGKEETLKDVRVYLEQYYGLDSFEIAIKIMMDGFLDETINELNWLHDRNEEEERILQHLVYRRACLK